MIVSILDGLGIISAFFGFLCLVGITLGVTVRIGWDMGASEKT